MGKCYCSIVLENPLERGFIKNYLVCSIRRIIYHEKSEKSYYWLIASCVFSAFFLCKCNSNWRCGKQWIAACNELVIRYWDYYTDYEKDVFLPPDYFGGFNLNEDNTLTMFVTDNSTSVQEQVHTICKSDKIKFSVVEYSFTYLVNAMNAITRNFANSFVYIEEIALDLTNNVVIVIPVSDAIDFESKWLSFAENLSFGKGINPAIYQIRVESAVKSNISSGMNVKATENPIQNRTTYTFYPGQQSLFGSNSTGTVGFCATDSLGRKLLITHSHGYGFTAYNQAKTVTVGGLSMSAYALSIATEDPLYDAAYIVIPSGVTTVLTNKVNNNTSKRISYVAYDYQLLSYNGAAVDAFGYVSGFVSTTASITLNSGNYYLNINSALNPGDSGGPIYLTGSSQNRLLGIISTQQGGGTLWKNIRDKYATVTGATLSPYISNT